MSSLAGCISYAGYRKDHCQSMNALLRRGDSPTLCHGLWALSRRAGSTCERGSSGVFSQCLSDSGNGAGGFGQERSDEFADLVPAEFAAARPGGAARASSLFAAEEEDDFDDEDDHDRQFEYEAARLIELVDHKAIELASGAELLLDQAAVIGNTDLCSDH